MAASPTAAIAPLLRNTQATLWAPFQENVPFYPLALTLLIALVFLLEWRLIVERIDIEL